MDERIFVVGPAPDVHNESFKRPLTPSIKKHPTGKTVEFSRSLNHLSLFFLSSFHSSADRAETSNGERNRTGFPLLLRALRAEQDEGKLAEKKTIRRSFCGGIERLIERGRSAKPSAKWAQLDELFTRQLVRGMDSVLWSLFFKQQNSWLERP